MKTKRNSFFRVALILMLLVITTSCAGGPAATTIAPTAPVNQPTVVAPTVVSAAGDKIVIASVMPFTGENAAYGPEQLAGCYPFEIEVEKAGGVVGATDVECKVVDTADDPTQAVAAARQLIATEPNLVAILGPTTNVAPAVIPLFDEAKVSMFVTTGDPVFNQTDFQYFWRLTPADDAIGRVLALTADQLGYTKGAAIFGSDLASQGAVPTLLDGWSRLGHEMVIQQTLAEGALSYRTEVLAVINANPDVIFLEADPQASSTFLAELKSLGTLPRIVGTAVTVQPEWQQAVTAAIGEDSMKESYVGVMPYTPSEGLGWSAYNDVLLTLGEKLDNPSQYSADGYAFAAYDGLVAAALAMEATQSRDPAVFNAAILEVTTPRGGAVVVYTFAEGKAALAEGKSIQFVGSGGQIAFDKWHNSSGGYEARAFESLGVTTQVVLLTAEQIAELATK